MVTIFDVPNDETVFPMENSGGVIVTGTGQMFGPVMTGADGRFAIGALPPGTFEVQAYKPGWLLGGAGQKDWISTSSFLALADRQHVTGANVRMWRWPSVTGRVLDERGQPMTGVDVVAMQATSVAGHPRFDQRGSLATTDDRGIFQFSPMPGSYVVAALTSPSLTQTNTPRAPSVNGRTYVYQAVFYPQAKSASDASALILNPGEERSDIDLQLSSVPAFRVTGQIAGATSLSGLSIHLDWGSDGSSTGDGTLTSTGPDPQGRFTMVGVPAGNYVLRAIKPPDMPLMTHGTAPLKSLPSEPTLWIDQPVKVTDRDVAVQLQAREGVRISGRIEFDGGLPTPSLDVLNRRAVTVDCADGTYGDLRGLFLREGRFTTIQIPPGRYLVRPGAPEGWKLKSVTVAGRNVADVPLTVGASDINDAVITFTDRASRIAGRVTLEASAPFRRVWVTIFPSDRALWTDFGRYPRIIQSIQTGRSGLYSAELPSGSYLVAATDEPWAGLPIPRAFEALAAVATPIYLGDRETRAIDLKVQRVSR
jgi:hypothetical protein